MRTQNEHEIKFRDARCDAAAGDALEFCAAWAALALDRPPSLYAAARWLRWREARARRARDGAVIRGWLLVEVAPMESAPGLPPESRRGVFVITRAGWAALATMAAERKGWAAMVESVRRQTRAAGHA